MINFYNITKEYPDGTVALDSVNLEIREEEFLFIVGPSGAGKSTLVKLLIREELPTQGEIYFEDTLVTRLKSSQLPKYRRQIGVVFQDFKLLPQRSVWENVAFAPEVVGKSRGEIEELVPHVLDLVDLEEKGHSFPHNLSGGEKQKLAIARALALEPKVLVADEPTGNIDIAAAWSIMDILEKINALGTCVVVATHNVDIVNSMRKRVVKLKKGKIIGDETEGQYL